MKTISEIRQFLKLTRVVNSIYNSKVSWEMKTNLIFSEALSGRLVSIYYFEWYDPDTTYEQELLAFVQALNIVADEFREIMKDLE